VSVRAQPRRCDWAKGDLDVIYHDVEWGVPSFDDAHLFELSVLEGAQAGLSWSTILKKREGYRAAFADFDAKKVARFTPARVERLLQNPAIVRNRLKVTSTLDNARAFLAVQRELGSFAELVWSFVDGEPVVNRFRSMKQMPAETPVSKAMSKELKRRGCRFVGPTICYAFMQAVGMVNDHLTGCYRHEEVGRGR
jgi:DNA-3-methyladenine glycosylase I